MPYFIIKKMEEYYGRVGKQTRKRVKKQTEGKVRDALLVIYFIIQKFRRIL